jgi:hypothetical protein
VKGLLHGLACADTGDAFSLWREPVGQGGRELIHAAVLAANAHNSQPWRFSQSERVIEVRADLDRHLGSFDPFRREMHQSLGCAIENLVHAALAQGREAQVETFPGSLPPKDGGPAARVGFAPVAAQQTELFDAIAKRHTHRGAYDASRALPARMREEMLALVDDPRLRLILFEGEREADLAELIVQSTREIVADTEMATDNAKWFRFRPGETEERRDGLTLGANVPSPLMATAARLLPPPATLANRSWIGATRTQVKTAALLGIIAVPDAHERALAIAAGRLWQRLHLLLTARGIAAQPLNQPVERADRERQLRLNPWANETLSRIIGDAGLQAAFVFRAGYPTREACLSPRRPLEEVIEQKNADDG